MSLTVTHKAGFEFLEQFNSKTCSTGGKKRLCLVFNPDFVVAIKDVLQDPKAL